MNVCKLKGAGLLISRTALVFSLVAAAHGRAHAQDNSDPGSLPQESPSLPEKQATENQAVVDDSYGSDIVVTAQLRTERLQEVPVSVEVLGGTELAEKNLMSLSSVSTAVPSVHVGIGSGRGANLYIRGTGSGANQSFDQSVGIFIDGIYHGRSRTTAGTFLDLERLEILKGPQSTFFGNNAIAGAFNIITAKPGPQSEGWVRTLISPRGKSGGQYALEGAVGVPLGDTFGIRLAATYNGQRGWIENINTGKHVPNDENFAARAVLAFAPSDSFDATLKLETSDNITRGATVFQTVNCPPPPGYVPAGFCATTIALGLPAGLDVDRYSLNDGSISRLQAKEAVFTANYTTGDHVLTSVTGYYRYKYAYKLDLDQTPLELLNVDLPEKFRQFSQEFRMASPTGQTVEYLAGAYFQDSHLQSDTALSYYFLTPTITSLAPFASLVPLLPLGQQTFGSQDERVWSLFGSATWNVTEQFKLTAGLRASWVKKDFDWQLLYGTATQDFGGIVPFPANLATLPNGIGLGTVGTVGLSRKDDALMPSVKAQYQITPNAMAYLSYSRGFKAGGFNINETSANPVNFPFAPEFVDAYEFGMKSEWFDRRLLLNLALFRGDYSDLQVSINQQNAAGGFFSLVRNAAASRAQGVELESEIKLTDWFHLSVAGTYLDSKYVSYPNAASTTAQRKAGILVQDLSGHRTPFAPKWSGTVTGTFKADLPGDYRMTTDITGIFRTEYDTRFGDDPFHFENGYLRLDARLSIESPDRRWAFDIIGKNLNDRTIILFSADTSTSFGSQNQQREQPRNIAFQVRFNW